MQRERHYTATVIKGCGFGRHFGIPTANMNLPLAWGVYTAQTQYGPIIIYSHGYKKLEGRSMERKLRLDALMPCMRNQGLAEGFILGFNGNIYGKDLEITKLQEIPKQYIDFISAIVCNFDHRRFCNERWIDIWPALGSTSGLNIYFSPFFLKITIAAIAIVVLMAAGFVYLAAK
jgi:hypothetical protein